MTTFRLAVATTLLLPLVAFAGDSENKYITKSYLNKTPPEIATVKTTKVNAKDGLTLKSLRGSLVLLLFTSTG